jgi:hypothetical protein
MFTNCRVPTPRRKKRGDADALVSPRSPKEAGRRWPDLPHRAHLRWPRPRPEQGTRRSVCRALDGMLPSLAPTRRGCNPIGFPHTPRRPYRQPAADAALKPCSATKTSFCSERNGSSSSRNTRTAAAGAARPGIDRHQPGFTPVLPDAGLRVLTRPVLESGHVGIVESSNPRRPRDTLAHKNRQPPLGGDLSWSFFARSVGKRRGWI